MEEWQVWLHFNDSMGGSVYELSEEGKCALSD